MRTLRSLICLLLIAGTAQDQAPTLPAIRAASRSPRYEPPDETQQRAAADLFLLLFSGEREGEKISALCRTISYEIVTVTAAEETIAVVRETEDGRKGRGLFAFRAAHRPAEKAAAAKQPTPMLLQAPHSYYDRYTGTIVERLFLEHAFTAAAWNTAHRFVAADGSSDLCHDERSFLNSFTRAFATANPKGLVVQIHGFAGEKRSTPGAAEAVAVLSNGTPLSTPWVKGTAACLARALAGTVMVYPDDIRELGATSNEQARLLRRLGRCAFLHIEFSLPARRRLKDDARLRRQVRDCLCGNAP